MPMTKLWFMLHNQETMLFGNQGEELKVEFMSLDSEGSSWNLTSFPRSPSLSSSDG